EASEEKFRDLFEHSSDLIQSVTPDGAFLYVNPAWKKALGYDDDEIAELRLFDMIHPDSLPHCRDMFSRLVAGEKLDHVEARFITKDGRTIVVEGNSSCRFENGKPVATRGTFRDVTRRKQAQERFARQAADLARSNAELERFAYAASHDLQEPLRAVAGHCRLLQQRYAGRLDAGADESLEYAVDGATRMKALIDGLLAYSRVGTRDISITPTDCEQVLDEAIANLKVSIDDSEATITRDPLPLVAADSTQLVELFQNLISNAIKYREDRSPDVHVGAEARNGMWVFSVRDRGIGIEPQHLERIFDVFQRLHTHDRYPGSGVGLAICKRIMERMGGTLWVDSLVGRGSTFYFTLPARKDRE
ncbi:MAG: ATP-binding protein, partial [Pirellulales bacterium]